MPLELSTTVPGLRLRELGPDDAPAYVDLAERNREHLSQLEGATSFGVEYWERELSRVDESRLRMGVWFADELVGYVELAPIAFVAGGSDVPASPNAFGLGYWIAADHAGRGFTTEACRALIDHARSELGADEYWSAASNENRASIAVLERLGFELFEVLRDRSRYRLQR